MEHKRTLKGEKPSANMFTPMDKMKKSMMGDMKESGMGMDSPDHHILMAIAELLQAGPRIHMIHLKTESFAAHIALDEFYKAAPGFADMIIEQYQGATEKLVEYPKETDLKPINTVTEAIDYLRYLYQVIQKAQDSCKYSEIINELDVIKSQINTTKYKLIFLK